jgi:hypothetical protein
VTAWGDVPTWFGVAAASAAGIAAFRQLSLQREQLRAQQRVLAQRVLLERQEIYQQLIAALDEWDQEAISTSVSGTADDAALNRRGEAARELLVKVELLGSLPVVDRAREAVFQRYRRDLDLTTGEGRDLAKHFPEMQRGKAELLKAMREDLADSRAGLTPGRGAAQP